MFDTELLQNEGLTSGLKMIYSYWGETEELILESIISKDQLTFLVQDNIVEI